jgi:hypothetical protein
MPRKNRKTLAAAPAAPVVDAPVAVAAPVVDAPPAAPAATPDAPAPTDAPTPAVPRGPRLTTYTLANGARNGARTDTDVLPRDASPAMFAASYGADLAPLLFRGALCNVHPRNGASGPTLAYDARGAISVPVPTNARPDALRFAASLASAASDIAAANVGNAKLTLDALRSRTVPPRVPAALHPLYHAAAAAFVLSRYTNPHFDSTGVGPLDVIGGLIRAAARLVGDDIPSGLGTDAGIRAAAPAYAANLAARVAHLNA